MSEQERCHRCVAAAGSARMNDSGMGWSAPPGMRPHRLSRRALLGHNVYHVKASCGVRQPAIVWRNWWIGESLVEHAGQHRREP